MKYLDILNTTLDGIIVTDAKGLITFCNQAANTLFGYEKYELHGQAIEVLIPKPLRQAHTHQHAKFVKESAPRNKTLTNPLTGLRKDGSELPVAISLSPAMINNERYTCASVQDLTQIHHDAEHLAHAQKLEVLGEMISGIAHNFNNVIAGISGQTYLLNKREMLSEKGTERVNTIDSLCTQASDVIKQLLTYARANNDTYDEFDLVSAMYDTIKITRATSPKNIAIKFSKPNDLMMLDGLKSQIQQALLNLLNNAIHAIGNDEGSINISISNCMGSTCGLSQCKLQRKESGTVVCIRVSDNGKGIEAKYLTRIFDPFFSSKPVGQGTGLGLSTSYGIVKKHGGDISVSSNNGNETLFQIYLPLSASQPQQTNTPTLSSPVIAKNTTTILIIDDEPSVNMILVEILSDLGYKTLSAKNGLQGVETFESHQDEIGLVISDVSMPILDGEQVLERVRLKKHDVPFLFITGYQDTSIYASLLDKKTKITFKPFDFSKLSHDILDLIE